MKCLTIHLPWAHLIVHEDLPDGIVQKRVENRTWATDFRGPLAIHAGKSNASMTDEWFRKLPRLTFGAILGVVDLVDCVRVRRSQAGRRYISVDDQRRHRWLQGHFYLEGPFAWVLENPVAFRSPIACCGQQGLFDIPDDVIADELRRAEKRQRSSVPPRGSGSR